MKKILLIPVFVFVVFNSNVFLQQSYVDDIFPLGVDSCWIYSFRTAYGIPALQTSTVDEGYIFYKIIASAIVPDSIEWVFSAKRDFIRTIHPTGHLSPIVEEHHDTLNFTIVEELTGNHQLHTKLNDYLSAFPFFNNAPDSEQFFRYVELDTSNVEIIQLIPNPDYPPFTVTYTLKKDKGILKTFGYMYSSGGWSVNNLFELVDQVNDIKIVQPEIMDYRLSQNYPNPFNPSTTISWQAPVSGWQTLKVYDILGNEVVTLVDEYRNAGSYEVDFNPASSIKKLASSVYFYQLRVEDYVETKKMILIK